MTRKLPLVSVIIPLHNGERFIRAAADSVLRQVYSNLELLVVDDGSTNDSLREVPSDARVRILKTKRIGNAAARNLGIAHSRGEFIAFLDQDDFWDVGKLEVQVQHLIEAPSCDAAICLVKYVIDPGTSRPGWLHDGIYEKETPAYLVGALLARRTLFDRLGGFDTTFDYGSDSDWFFRATDSGAVIRTINATLLYKRVHDRNQSHRIDESRHDLFRAAKLAADRKRNATRPK